MDLTADTDGLGADGSALQSSAAAPGDAPRCTAAAKDAVSAHLAESLTAWAQTLHSLHVHGGQLRVAGGLALNGTARTLAGADADNEALINAIIDGAGGGAASPSPAPTGGFPNIAPPALPGLPVQAPPIPMPGEQIAEQVHSGPGTSGLRSFSGHIRGVLARAALDAAGNVRNVVASTAQNWQDQQQQASQNISQHADWLETSLHPQIVALADATDQAAEHTETLIKNTPHPQEFTDVKRRLRVAMQNYNASGGVNAAQVTALTNELNQKRTTAMTAYQTFSAAAPPTISGAAQPPTPAPPIVDTPGPAINPLQPAAQTDTHAPHSGPADGKHHGGDGPADPDLPTTPDPAATGIAAPQAAPGVAATPPNPAAANTFAAVAGQVMGVGSGAVGQLTHGLGGGGSPLSALSSLSSLPSMGQMPHMGQPEMPDSGGQPGGSPEPDPGAGDFGSGGTTPAGDSGGGGGGAPMSSSSPAVGPPTGSTINAGALSPGPAASPTGPANAMGPMMPPMTGGMGNKQSEGRKSDERFRVVERPVANSEPVFGEVRREPRRRRDPDKKADPPPK